MYTVGSLPIAPRLWIEILRENEKAHCWGRAPFSEAAMVASALNERGRFLSVFPERCSVAATCTALPPS